MNHPSTDILTGLPAEELLRKGLRDLSAGAVTVASCLVRIIAPRLVRAGLVDAAAFSDTMDAELKLYELLQAEGDRAYSLYNSHLRELTSFGHALDQRLRQAS
jgi:hypothetical protein